MKKRFMRIIALCMAVLCVVSAGKPAMAAVQPEEPGIEPQSSQFLGHYTAYIKTSGSKLTVYYNVVGTTTMDQIGATRIIVYKSKDKSTWTSMRTYTYREYSNLLGTNTIMYGSHVNYSGTTGYYYRAVVTIYAEKDGGCDSRLYTTSSVLL